MNRRFLIWYWSATGGGGSQFAVNLARRLALKFGDAAITLSLHAADPLLRRSATYGFRTLAAAVSSNRLYPWATIAGIESGARILADHASGADCVIIPMNFAMAAPLMVTIKQPSVYFAHDPAPHEGDYAALAQRTTQAILLRRCTQVVALSQYAQAQLARGPAARKLRLAPLGAVFEPSPMLEGERDGPLRLLFAGRMMDYKGLDILAGALPAIATRSGWRLTVAGAGPALTDAMKSRLRSPQVDRVHDTWLGEAELEALIAHSDVLLAPYRSATQSGVVAQALAHGKPCVVTPVGALPEQIGDGKAGWVASAPNAEAFGETLCAVLDDARLRQEKARAAHALAHAAWRSDPWSWLEDLAS